MQQDNHIGVVLPAGGSGTRLGSAIPKQFLSVGGVPIIAHTVRTILQIPNLETVVIAAHPDNHDLIVRVLTNHHCNDPRIHLVKGGSERQESISNALKHRTLNSVGVIGIHDVVRPFASLELWNRVIQSAMRLGAVIPALPVTDTLKEVDGKGLVVSTPDRSIFRRAQTPQCFQRALILDAYQRGVVPGQAATDCAALCEKVGIPVYVVDGEERNIKITTPFDMEIANIFYAA